MTRDKILLLLIALGIGLTCPAENLIDDLQLNVRAGYSVGGTAPIGIPATIRSIDSYSLTPSFMAGAEVTLPVASKWNLTTGLHLENKGMKAKITTKGYRMEMVKGDSKMEGLFTGRIKQDVTQWMLTLPVQAAYSLSPKVQLKAGPYLSLLLSRDFSGIASDGYLRQSDPTGAKIIIGDKEGEWATYDFNDEMRRLQFGLGVGVDWKCYRNFGVSADLNWGLTGIFKSKFKTIEQTLYPIYGTVSVFYQLK